jgi:hypothetical protein
MNFKAIFLKSLFVICLHLFAFNTVVAQEVYNVSITLTASNDSVRSVILKADTISVFYILANKKEQIHAIAIKKSDSTFQLKIPNGFVMALAAGYQNCHGGESCFEIAKGKAMTELVIPIEARDHFISKIMFFLPCPKEESFKE